MGEKMYNIPVDVADMQPDSVVGLADYVDYGGAESAYLESVHSQFALLPSTHPDLAPARQARLELKKVLVVEDMVDTAHSLAEVLEIWGYDVRIAYDGQSAVELAQSFMPKFIVMDIGLPILDGYQAASLMRADDRLRNAILIALTGYGLDEDKRRAEAAGFHAHMTKPADLARLQQLLQ